MTLGNKKKVDIVVALDNGTYFTVDVKAVSGRFDWPVGSKEPERASNHYYIFVCYENKFNSQRQVPTCWIVPSEELLPPFIKVDSKGKLRFVQRTIMVKQGGKWLENWGSLKEQELVEVKK